MQTVCRRCRRVPPGPVIHPRRETRDSLLASVRPSGNISSAPIKMPKSKEGGRSIDRQRKHPLPPTPPFEVQGRILIEATSNNNGAKKGLKSAIDWRQFSDAVAVAVLGEGRKPRREFSFGSFILHFDLGLSLQSPPSPIQGDIKLKIKLKATSLLIEAPFGQT